MKLPNGYGSVYKLSGKRRNPYAVRKTIGWNDKGHPIYQFIGYYKTKKEAYAALAEFNKNPYDLRAQTITFGELHQSWAKEFYPTKKKSTIKSYESATSVLEPIMDVCIRKLHLLQLQALFNDSGKTRAVLNTTKIVLGHVFDYAIKNEILTPEKKQMLHYLDVTKSKETVKVVKNIFTKDEIEELWERVSDSDSMIPLMLIYSGVRIGELLALKKEDVHIDERYFDVTDSKTKAGIRQVPIAEKTVGFFEHWMESDSEYLIPNSNGDKFHPNTFRTYHFQRAVSHLKSHVIHTPHEARHTCISLLTEVGVDPRVIKQIVGHTGSGVTEQVYTHISLETKLEAINKI